MKSNTVVALAYIRSEFFRLSLEMAAVYKMIQDKIRNNETILIHKSQNIDIEEWMAGPRFHKDFLEETKNLERELIKKIHMGIFTQNKEITPAAWREYGNEGILTVNPFYGIDKPCKQMDTLKSNIYIMSEIAEFDNFFAFKKRAQDPANPPIKKSNLVQPSESSNLKKTYDTVN